MYNITPCLCMYIYIYIYIYIYTHTQMYIHIYIYMYIYVLFQSFVTVISPFISLSGGTVRCGSLWSLICTKLSNLSTVCNDGVPPHPPAAPHTYPQVQYLSQGHHWPGHASLCWSSAQLPETSERSIDWGARTYSLRRCGCLLLWVISDSH